MSCPERFEAVGGVAANVALGVAKLGHAVSAYSKVGEDDAGSWIRYTLKAAGIQTERVEVDQTVKSDLSAIVVIQQTGDRIIFHNRDASEKLQFEQSKMQGYDWFHASALNGDWRKNLKMIFSAAERFGTKVMLNPGQHNLKEDPRLLLECLPHVSVLCLNKDEALELLLSGGIESSPERLNDERSLIQMLHDFGPAVVALTDGKRGVWTYDGQELWHGAAYEPRGVVDTTGAGDAFGSGFFAAYLYHYPLEKCLRYGVANAGSVVGAYGGGAGLLDQEQVEREGKAVQTTLIANR